MDWRIPLAALAIAIVFAALTGVVIWLFGH